MDTMDNAQNEMNQHEQLEQQLKRALADYANLKNRYDKELADNVKMSTELLMMQLIGVLDGLEMTAREFYSILARNGFSRVEIEVGSQFDATMMEVVETDGKSQTVLEVLAPGYKLNERVIRPARVRLGEVKENHG